MKVARPLQARGPGKCQHCLPLTTALHICCGAGGAIAVAALALAFTAGASAVSTAATADAKTALLILSDQHTAAK